MTRKVSGSEETAPTQRNLSKAWLPFEKSLAAVLAQLEEDQYLVISVKRSGSYVQFAGQGSFGMRAETASNSYLPKAERLDHKQLEAMAAIGWRPPTGSPDSATPEKDPDGSPNFFQDNPSR